MARRTEDVVEAEVQRRLTDAFAAAGVDGGRVALEVLFMLPPEFVRLYRQLFDSSLSWAPQSTSGQGKDQGNVKASGAQKKDPMHARSLPSASTSGKRWHKRHFQIRSELALAEKRKLDRRLVRAVEDAIRAARAGDGEEKEENRDRSDKRTCSGCGRRMATGWVRCPFH